MTTTEYTGVFTQVDDSGNEILLYPNVKTDTTLSLSDKAADAAAVGTKISELINKIGTFIESTTIASGSTTATIENSAIGASSIIDIYYAEASKDTVAAAGVTYSQTDGSLTITFGEALGADVTIDYIKVVNV